MFTFSVLINTLRIPSSKAKSRQTFAYPCLYIAEDVLAQEHTRDFGTFGLGG